jgi:hypothetical protein
MHLAKPAFKRQENKAFKKGNEFSWPVVILISTASRLSV